LLRGEGTRPVDLWAVHGGGRTVLDAVEIGLSLPCGALEHSRAVLREFGNMSSATLMFVLRRMLAQPDTVPGGRGFAMAFGPGMVAETFRFTVV
jgi:predicted naringenin-chalcone synthase